MIMNSLNNYFIYNNYRGDNCNSIKENINIKNNYDIQINNDFTRNQNMVQNNKNQPTKPIVMNYINLYNNNIDFKQKKSFKK